MGAAISHDHDPLLALTALYERSLFTTSLLVLVLCPGDPLILAEPRTARALSWPHHAGTAASSRPLCRGLRTVRAAARAGLRSHHPRARQVLAVRPRQQCVRWPARPLRLPEHLHHVRGR